LTIHIRGIPARTFKYITLWLLGVILERGCCAQALLHLLKLLCDGDGSCSVMLVDDAGCGKSSILEQYLVTRRATLGAANEGEASRDAVLLLHGNRCVAWRIGRSLSLDLGDLELFVFLRVVLLSPDIHEFGGPW
jgi:hypothetical protein